MKKTIISCLVLLCVATAISYLLSSLISLKILAFTIIWIEICGAIFILLVAVTFVYSIIKYRYSKAPLKNSIFFLICFWMAFFFGSLSVVWSTTINRKARSHIKALLSDVNAEKVVIKIDGVESRQKKMWLKALQDMRSTNRHSTSIKSVECEIEGLHEELKLIVNRDANPNNLYWVFYPKYYCTKLNTIGCFYSDNLDLEQKK